MPTNLHHIHTPRLPLQVTNVMEEMSRRNRDMFVVPPYILYVARAFSTLEGIGLSASPEYSLISEVYYCNTSLLVY